MEDRGEDVIEWVEIPAGEFVMGASVKGGGDDEKSHRVSVDAFQMSKYLITFDRFDEYCKLLGLELPSDSGWGRGERPVVNVDWYMAYKFASYLNCSLPTEAQWEYACRAGSSSAFFCGNDIDFSKAKFDCFGENVSLGILQGTVPVGSFPSNSWGLFDMCGNVWEWCSDFFADYQIEKQSNPKGPSVGQTKVLRGGCWLSDKYTCRSDYRFQSNPEFKSNMVGFRLVKNY